jgi:hypothetical protein
MHNAGTGRAWAGLPVIFLKPLSFFLKPAGGIHTRYVHSAKIGAGKEKMVMPVRSALEKIKAGFAG